MDVSGLVTEKEVEGLSGAELESYIKRAKRIAMVSLLIKVGIIISALMALADGSYVWVFAGLFALIFSFVPTILKKNYQITIPWILELLIFLALFLHVAGGVFGLYGRFGWWDTMTHFVSTFMLAVVGLTVVYIMHVYWDGLKMDIRAIMVFTLFIAAFLGATWELLEWSADQIFDTSEQHGLNDTMKDLVMDMIGAMIAAMLGAKWILNGTLRRMTADLGDAMNEKVFGRIGAEMAETVADEAGKA
ncbi:MAG: hypothetical protein KAQ96_09605 [Thermoplasmata archaeon]|nr:hypothetical protein [Thermoplasmata archaeon]